MERNINYFGEFKSWYVQIRKDFGFSYEEDKEARNLLDSILKKKGSKYNLNNILLQFANLLRQKKVIYVFGAGPSLEMTVDEIIGKESKAVFHRGINLAADGATMLLKKKGIPINAIFSDLDGISEDEFFLSPFTIIHAHGDNMSKLHAFEKAIKKKGNLIGTTQVAPTDLVLNPGGFTDGDRILFFLRLFLLPDHTLYLIGMDFDDIVGKYSKPDMKTNQKASDFKKKKLTYGMKLVEWFMEIVDNQIYFINSPKVSQKFHYLTIEEFQKQMNK